MRAALALIAFLATANETITVNLVEVPVTVVDRSGNPVRGLTAANFEIIDEGKPRAITTFDKIDYAAPPATQQISPLNPAARRYFMLLFDLSFSSPTAVAKAQEAARNFVIRSTTARDLVSVATIDTDRGFRTLTAFTSDRSLLAEAINDPRTYQASDPLQIAGTAVFPSTQDPWNAGGADRKTAAAEIEEMRKREAKLDDNFTRARIEKEISMLGGLARTLRAIPGRKQVVLLSEGFDPRLVQGREAKMSQEMKAENEAASYGEVWKIDTDSRFGSAQSLGILERMPELFRRSDVMLHAIDIQGLRVQNDTQGGAKTSLNDGLFLLARPTGGEVFRNSNDLKADLDRMLHQQEVVYVLGFQTPVGTAGRFHPLKVKLVNVPGAQIVQRAGYYETGNESAIERSLSNAEIVLNDIPQRDVRVSAMAAAFPTSTANSQVPVIVEINGADVLKDAKGSSVAAEVFVYAFDADGLVRDRVYQQMSLDLSKVGEKLRAGGIKYYTTLSLPEGTYAIRSLVRAVESDRKGFSRVDVVVPKAGGVALTPPVFIDEAPTALMVKGASHATAPYPFEIDGQSFIPSTTPSKKFAVFATNVAAGEDVWETNPAAKLVKQVRSADGTSTKLLYELPAIDPSMKTLSVTVRKKDSSDARTASVTLP